MPCRNPAPAPGPVVGRRRRALAGLAACLLGLAAAQLPALAQDWTLQALMRELAARKSGRARFQETRTLAMLDAPIHSSGVLLFAAPDRLEVRTTSPKPQTVLVRGSRVIVEADGARHEFELSEHAQVAAMVDGIRATLDGDLDALRKAYAVRLRGDRATWSLELVPRLPAARARISEIDVGGSGATVRSIAIFQPDGDHSLMVLHEMSGP